MPKKLLLFILLVACTLQASAAPTVDYRVSISNHPDHIVRVNIRLPAGATERDVQMPVWNALYQIRDFAQYVRAVKGTNNNGQPLTVHKLDKTTWHITGAQDGADIAYEIYANLPGPFGAELTAEHAFFNLAEILMYAEDARSAPVTITFTDVPTNWAVATALDAVSPSLSPTAFRARNYDHLVDSPVEIGALKQVFFQDSGSTYRVVVHADPADFDMQWVVRTVHAVVKTEVDWMKDRPFDHYLFILHFPRSPGGGGMEHAYSCAVEIGADRLREDPMEFTSLVAHEFFHLWNVKRIRPQSLEPIDYTRENYTSALWFSEGVTTAVADYMLLRINALDDQRWFQSLARTIREVQDRPAHRTQSAEESSLDAWLQKYPDYYLPERSISYYDKGQLIGILLDLAIRDATQGHRSLRDVFHWMNRNYAQKGRFFPDSAGVRQAVEAVTGADFRPFFDHYVAGVDDLPYDRYLQTVGLRLEHYKATAPYPGFVSIRNFDTPPIVARVDDNSDAARLGLEAGDTIVRINGKPASSTVENRLYSMHIGGTLKLRVSGRTGERDLKLKLSARLQDEFRLVNLEAITSAQRARRAAWLSGEDELPTAAPGAVRAEVIR